MSTTNTNTSSQAHAPPGSAIPWHYRPLIFPTSELATRFAHRPKPKKPLPSHSARFLTSLWQSGGGGGGGGSTDVKEDKVMTLQDAEKKCPLYEIVQYKCDVHVDGVIRCQPVVRLFRK